MTRGRHGQPKRPAYTGQARTTGCIAIHTACRIARAFPTRAPTEAELMALVGMSKATANRWARAWRDAHGVTAGACGGDHGPGNAYRSGL